MARQNFSLYLRGRPKINSFFFENLPQGLLAGIVGGTGGSERH